MQPGQVIADRFTVERLANTGGMGAVYRAIDSATGGPVAVKVLQGCSELAADLFARESEVLARLRHPGIVEYVAHGRTDDGSLWLSMEWLEGEDLDSHILRGPLSVRDTLALGKRAAEALGAAHAASVVHRDIKPSNLIIVGGDYTRTKIVDFGIARSRQATRPATRTGTLMGTPGYMPPEQTLGAKDLDQTADVFALGCVLYECLTGQAAFEGEHVMVVLAKILIGDTPHVREFRRHVPEALDALVARMMSRDPGRRPRDGAAVAREIEAIEGAGEVLVPSSRRVADEPPRSAPARWDVGLSATMPAYDLSDPTSTDAPPLGEVDATTQRLTVLLEAPPFLGAPPLFFGRERELGVLDAFYGECVFTQGARVALVTGPPGIGKSALCQQFLTRVKAGGQPPEVWLGKGAPLLRGSPFSLLARAVRRAAGIEGNEPLRTRQLKLRSRIALNLPPSDVDRVAAYMGQMAGIPPAGDPDLPLRAALQDARLMGAQIRRAFEDWLAAEAAVRPLVLVLEDLEWGDGASVALVAAAVRHLRDRPLFVLATGQPDVQAAFPELFVERTSKLVPMSALSPEASAARVVSALEPLGLAGPPEVTAQIIERAEGNPLLLEELIRAAAELRFDTRRTAPISPHEALEESVAFLPAEARRVLSAASVFGDAFTEIALLALLRDAGADWSGWLAGRHWLTVLIDRELILQGTGQGTGQGVTQMPSYAFRHDLLREVVYAALPPAERERLHLRAGEWLERMGQGEPGALARHFELGGQAARAAGFCVVCAERSLEGDDTLSIMAWADRARRLGASGQLLGTLHLLSAEAHKWRGEQEAALGAALAAMRELPPGSAHWYSAAGQAALVSGNMGDEARLIEVFEQLRAQGAAATAPHVIALSRVALQLLQTGLHALSEAAFAELETVDADVLRRDPEVSASIHRARAFRGRALGDFAVSRASFAASAQAFEEVGDLLNACVQQVNVGWASLELGAFADAERALREALTRTRRLGLSSLTAFAQHQLGLVLARLGQLHEAHIVEAEARDAYSSQGNRRLEGESKIYLSIILALGGQLVAAGRQAEEAVEVAAAHASVRAFALAALAQVRMLEGRVGDALLVAREAMRLLEELESIDEGEALVRLVYAAALGQAGFADMARAAIASARDHLLARADRISDPALRASFLERVPENARTLMLARQWAGAGSPPWR